MENATVYNFTSPAVTSISILTTAEPKDHLSQPIRTTLIVIYIIVLLVGITGLTFMISLLKTNIRSLTTIAFLNLMVSHFLFLITVPFRIYYFALMEWKLGPGFCKLVSAMVHLHIYMVFTIYAILLTLRFLHFYKKTQRTEFYRRLHALGMSAFVWFLLLVIVLPLVISKYGDKNKEETKTAMQQKEQCFHFEQILENKAVYGLNIILSLVIITVSCVQACVQVSILRTMILKYGASSRSQQEFWVQMKNLCFVLIMLICLVPYHMFRMEYLNRPNELSEINEVFLAITGLTCFDMLTFAGKGMCTMCTCC
ncbi:LOW QUALITY PROTEIN: probable G-protein coupled receptor 141 [Danio aesculapii]|uniref:LOW QUALITY PROTEIN: probable G-protein coupled receptor 141 n=1 Tax=Danio aesculapii TaxID=1142201 RepID=UPI0024BF18FF|nr:LOW QUALITY PROTEIN: probable G-protein coupled receptor 141 [Danio aesculapii]